MLRAWGNGENMRIPTVGWAFFGLAVAILIGFLLNIGIYIGADFATERSLDGKIFYSKNCRYLYLNGTRDIWSGGVGDTPEEASADKGSFCRPLRKLKMISERAHD